MTAPQPTTSRPRAGRWRLAALAGASLVLVGGAAIAMAASPAPSTSPDTDTTTPGADGFGPFGGRGPGAFEGFAGFAGRHGGFGAGNISITAIDGSSLALETADGWTRTIALPASTTITKDGATATLADLAVGDRIRFRQAVDDAGVYSVVAIDVVVPTVVGQVTAMNADSLTLVQRDGSSVTVHLDAATQFTVGGETGASLADIEVGMIAAASGEQNDDGSLDASRVRAGPVGQGLGRGRDGRGPGPWLNPAPSATPEDTSTSAG